MSLLTHSTDRDRDTSRHDPAVPHVLLVSEVFPPAIGGSGHLLESVYSRLERSEVRVLTDARTSGGVDTRRGRLRIDRVRMNGKHWGVLNPYGLRSHLTVARAIWMAASRGQAIVHCGRALPEGVAAAMAAALPAGPKFVFWAHGEEITTALTSRDFAFSMRRVHAAAVAAIANSRHTAELLESVGMPASKIHVVLPGVDTARFGAHVDGREIRRRFAPRGETLMLSLGRCQRRKGFDLAIRALAALAGQYPSLRHVIVGDGEDRERLERLAIELGVRDRVAFTGAVPASELPKYFAACDVFVHPNRIDAHDFEGFGLVFLEAAAAEKPAIGGASGGVREAVEDGVTGLLVSGTDVSELALAIARLIQSEPLRRRLGRAARARVLDSFTWERAADAVAAIHARVAAEP